MLFKLIISNLMLKNIKIIDTKAMCKKITLFQNKKITFLTIIYHQNQLS